MTEELDFDQPEALEGQLVELDVMLGMNGHDTLEMAVVNDFADLDAFLRESMAAKAQQEAVRESRKRLAKGGLSKEEHAELDALIRAWDLKKDWRPVAVAAVFNTQKCLTCGNEHPMFQGFYQKQISTSRQIERWVEVPPSANQGLPREVKETLETTDWCMGCITVWQEERNGTT